MSETASLDLQWKRFAHRVLPGRVSDIQRSEMEQAFKAGAVSVLLEMRLTVAELPEDEAIEVLKRWEDEYEAFLASRLSDWMKRFGAHA